MIRNRNIKKLLPGKAFCRKTRMFPERRNYGCAPVSATLANTASAARHKSSGFSSI